MFLDKDDICTSVSEAYETKDVDIQNDVVEIDGCIDDNENAPEAMGTLTAIAINKPTGCIINFDNGNSLCVVGSGSSFYMIDLLHGIFNNTNGPEYDVNTYVDEYGSEHFKLQFFALKDREREKTPPPAPAAKKPRKKVVRKEEKPKIK